MSCRSNVLKNALKSVLYSPEEEGRDTNKKEGRRHLAANFSIYDLRFSVNGLGFMA